MKMKIEGIELPTTKLYDAALEGDVKSLLDLLQSDPLILDRCSIEKSVCLMPPPLHVAANRGHLEFTKEVLRRKPELAEEVDPLIKSTPLHLAVANGHLEVVKALVKVNPNMSLERNQDGRNPVHVAAIKGHLDVLDELLRAKPLAAYEQTSAGETILHLSIKHDQPKAFKLLLKVMDNAELINAKDAVGNTILHLANGHLEIVRAVVAANPNLCLERNQDGRNPIHVAAIKGQQHVLSELLQAKPEAAFERTGMGETALHLCVKYNQLDALKCLVAFMDNAELLNAKDLAGNTVLHLAVAGRQPEMVKYLLEDKRTDINAINGNDFTAMDICLKSKHKSFGAEILESLNDSKALAAKAAKIQQDRDRSWSENQRDALMVVASLIATMAFQLATNPPGGVWQDDDEKKNRTAGLSVMGYKDTGNYKKVIIANTVGLVSSLSVIILLISGVRYNRYVVGVLMVIMWMAVSATAVTYLYSVAYLSSAALNNSYMLAVQVALAAWMILMASLLVAHAIRFMVRLIKKLGRWVQKQLTKSGNRSTNTLPHAA